MRKTVVFVFLLLSMCVFSFASGLESKGIGARGRGMGFAMIAIADDWTAVHYNPAGIGMIEQDQFGFEYEYFTGVMESTKSLRNLAVADENHGDFLDLVGDEPTSFNEKTISSNIHFGALGYVKTGDSFSFGMGLYGSGSGTAWEDSVSWGGTEEIDAKVEYLNGSANIPLVFAYRVSSELSLGATLGIHWGLLKYERTKERTGIVFPYLVDFTQDTTGIGISLDFGALWKVKENISLGAVVKLPYFFRRSGPTNVEAPGPFIVNTDTNVDTRYPLRIGLGGAVTMDENLFAFGLVFHNYKAYRMLIDTESPLLADDDSNPYNWENTFVLNFGYERQIDEKWTFRTGLTWDQAPEPDGERTLIGGQVVDAWLLSAGAGVNLGDKTIDFGMIYTYAPPVEGFVPGAEYSMNLLELFIGYIHRF